MRHVIKPKFNAKDKWCRVEFAGGEHIHYVVWCAGTPDLDEEMSQEFADFWVVPGSQAVVQVDRDHKHLVASLGHLQLTHRELDSIVNRVNQHECGPYCRRKDAQGNEMCRFKYSQPDRARQAVTPERTQTFPSLTLYAGAQR
ncbi:hypothetical protein GE09DRAFT_1220051 [Coniochaeta sp. 2T2.1]|nr:hypothetical protein GE09DRAFT_1220051 [Coniochaeta sp. 2T2.1]